MTMVILERKNNEITRTVIDNNVIQSVANGQEDPYSPFHKKWLGDKLEAAVKRAHESTNKYNPLEDLPNCIFLKQKEDADSHPFSGKYKLSRSFKRSLVSWAIMIGRPDILAIVAGKEKLLVDYDCFSNSDPKARSAEIKYLENSTNMQFVRKLGLARYRAMTDTYVFYDQFGSMPEWAYQIIRANNPVDTKLISQQKGMAILASMLIMVGLSFALATLWVILPLPFLAFGIKKFGDMRVSHHKRLNQEAVEYCKKHNHEIYNEDKGLSVKTSATNEVSASDIMCEAIPVSTYAPSAPPLPMAKAFYIHRPDVNDK